MFFEKALELSNGVISKNKNYDVLMSEIDNIPQMRRALDTLDADWIGSNFSRYSDVFAKFDLGFEDRARHFTSNLVKIGFTDKSRNITEVGDLIVNNSRLKKDALEALLPIESVNIIYLRQMLKMRVFNEDGRYYSPFLFAIYSLLRKERVSQKEFREMVQGISPYDTIDDIDGFIDNYKQGDVWKKHAVTIPPELDIPDKLPENLFLKYFGNKKSKKNKNVYYDFYIALYDFLQLKTPDTLDKMLTYYEENKSVLNKAFGYGENIFKTKKGKRPLVEFFLETEEADFLHLPFNRTIYVRFVKSKYFDSIREYADTTMRMFKATGIISVDNGYVELAYKKLCDQIFIPDKIAANIMGVAYDTEKYTEYFRSDHSLTEIMQYSENEVKVIFADVRKAFGGAKIEDIPQIIKNDKRKDFEKFISRKYPEEKVTELLSMFADRSNDKAIQDYVCPSAAIPTIYEHIVGIAWYYFSDKTIDILSSFNLAMSADFEPLSHAAGGKGDIVIYEKDKVIMLEVTLMNPNSQKRGEWEPVLRHSVNLKADEEAGENREVTTFFIADTFDFNTINIWKAVSSVPLQSSSDKSRYTENVIIMPVSSDELIKLIRRKSEYNSIIKNVRELFLKDVSSFDKDWRDKFIDMVIKEKS